MQSVTSNAVAEALGYLVWENPDSTQTFLAQDIVYDRVIPNEYSRVKIEFRALITENYKLVTECDIGDNTYLTNAYVVLSGNARCVVVDRLARNPSRTGVNISEGRMWQSSNNTQQENNNRIIPTRIWAIK